MKIKRDYMTSLFIIYVACYFYSAFNDYEVGNIEYVALALIIVGSATGIARKTNNFKFFSSKLFFYRETLSVLVMTLIMGIISLFFQIIHFSMHLDLIRQMIFLFGPCLIVFCIYNSKKVKIDRYIDIVLIGAVIFFVLKFKDQLTVANILSINFRDSYSPFEVSTSSITDIFFYCCVFYTYRKKKIRFLIGALFCFLSFKRMMIAGLLLLAVFNFFIEPIKRIFKCDGIPETLNRKVYSGGIFLFSLAPFFMWILMRDSVAEFFYSSFEIDLNQIVKGRFEILNYLIDNKPVNWGLGTVVDFMKNCNNHVMRSAGALHNDLYRLYYETTFIGLLVFVYTQFRNSKYCTKGLYLTVFLMINLIISNTLTNFISMILFYMLVCEFKNDKVEKCRMS